MNQKNQLSQETLDQIKLFLSYGDVTNIAKTLKCNRGTVYNVLNQRSNNVKILAEIIKVLEKKQDVIQKIYNAIDIISK
jgi:hypothetical protein